MLFQIAYARSDHVLAFQLPNLQHSISIFPYMNINFIDLFGEP